MQYGINLFIIIIYLFNYYISSIFYKPRTIWHADSHEQMQYSLHSNMVYFKNIMSLDV